MISLILGLGAWTTGCGKKTPKPQPPAWQQLFSGESPGLKGPYQGLRFGMTRAEADRVAPQLVTAVIPDKMLPGRSAYRLHFQGALDAQQKILTAVAAHLPRSAMALARRAWGRPTRSRGPKRTWWFWYDKKAGVRVALTDAMGHKDHVRLEIERYLPLKRFLGGKEPRFGFETLPLMGAQIPPLAKAYGRYLAVKSRHRAQLVVPANEVSRYAHVVWLELEKDRVVKIELTLSVDREVERTAIHRAMQVKFGPPKRERVESVLRPPPLVLSYANHPGVRVSDSRAQRAIKITIARK